MKELLDGFSVEELEAMIARQPEDSVGRLARIALAVKHAQPITVELKDVDSDAVKAAFAKGMERYSGAMLEIAERQPASENIALQNFRAAMEGIGHIRRTLEETFGGLHGTHVEPDVLVECKAICDAICEAYRNSPAIPDGWQEVADVVSKFGDPEAFGERELSVQADIQKMPYGTKFYAPKVGEKD